MVRWETTELAGRKGVSKKVQPSRAEACAELEPSILGRRKGVNLEEVRPQGREPSRNELYFYSLLPKNP